jgi:hypothetical protein
LPSDPGLKLCPKYQLSALFCGTQDCVHGKEVCLYLPCKKADPKVSDSEREVIIWTTMISPWVIKNKNPGMLTNLFT